MLPYVYNSIPKNINGYSIKRTRKGAMLYVNRSGKVIGRIYTVFFNGSNKPTYIMK